MGGQITADAALDAFNKGLGVTNILRFLEGAAHPRALQRRVGGASVVPENVRVQLEVWQSVRSRTATRPPCSSSGILAMSITLFSSESVVLLNLIGRFSGQQTLSMPDPQRVGR